MDSRLAHIYIGQRGSGKTNIVMGLAIRASGANFKIWFAQYLEKDTEICNNFETFQKGSGSGYEFFSRESLSDSHEKCFMKTRGKASSGKYDLVILDGALNALEERELVEIVDSKNKWTELVLTGTEASKTLLSKVQLVTRIRNED